GRCLMTIRTHRRAPWRRMPVLAAFLGVAMLLWIAENVGTAAGAWLYPHQQAGWHLVPPSKYVSWLLLMMVSVVLVTLVHRPRQASALRSARRGGPAWSRGSRRGASTARPVGSSAPRWGSPRHRCARTSTRRAPRRDRRACPATPRAGRRRSGPAAR